MPRIDDPLFVSQVVFDTRLTPGTPKARFAYLFPNRSSALITIRLRPDLTDAQRHQALTLIRQAVFDTTPRRACGNQPCFALHGGHYVVSGVPVVVDGLAGVLKDSLLVLFAAAVVLMAATLAVVFRSRLRLLPLAIALGSCAVTFAALGVLGGSLTMASIAVLPVLIGLAVDYAIQLQARFNEALEGGVGGAQAARAAATHAAPVIATAGLATAAGFAVLLFSPVPMVRSFGLMLCAGILIAFLAALTVGFGALALGAQRPAGRGFGARIPAPAILISAKRIGQSLRDRIVSRLVLLGKSSLAVAIESPGRVLAVAFALALCGWVAGTATKINSDIRQLVPQTLPALRDANELQRATGVSGELDVLVHAPDLTDPRLISWMSSFKQRVLARHHFAGQFPSCQRAQLCPGTALSDFFPNSSQGLSASTIDQLLSTIPVYDSQAVVTRSPRTGQLGHTADISFGIRQMPLDQQQRLIDDIRSQINPPGANPGLPPNVSVQLVGLPVLAAASDSALAGSRYWLTLAGLIAVAIALLAVYRNVSRALIPLLPIVLATGWSSLIIAAIGIPLNPMSATLGALVIAISTEFSVILAARYHEERRGGNSLGEALRRAYARTGAAVLASGTTAIAGFAALIASNIAMLRDFGFVTVVDLAVALAGVMLVLPAVLVWAESSFEVRGVPLPRRLAMLPHPRLARGPR